SSHDAMSDSHYSLHHDTLPIFERNGQIGASISKKIHYLVVGSIGNDQWLHSTYGTKIKKAVELREAGAPLSIVSEEHWQKAVFRDRKSTRLNSSHVKSTYAVFC